MPCTLWQIYDDHVKLDKSVTVVYRKVLDIVLKNVIDNMKDKNRIFDQLYSRIYYTGSVYDGLKVGSSEQEFDVNIVFKIRRSHVEIAALLKEKVSKAKSPRLKPTTPIKAASPLRTVPPEMTAPLATQLPTTATPPTEASPEKNSPSLTSNKESPILRPPCAVSVLTDLVPGIKLRVMKETKMSLRYFSSICLTVDESIMNYLLDDLQADAAVFRDSGAVSLSPSVGSWVVAWSSSDQMYYRAVILAVTQLDTYTALLIDFAMTQQFNKIDLLDMWPDAARRKALAIQLSAVGDISPEVENLCNAHFDANTTADCVVTEVSDDQITVLIPELGVRLTASPWYHCDSKARTLFEECDEIVMMKELRTSKLAEGATVRYCGHGDKICDVYIKRESDEENVKSLMRTLNEAMCSRDNREYKEPVIGSIVAVKWTPNQQNMFYRASVTSINKKEKKAKLLLVDYGIRIVEDWTSISWLPKEVRKAPMYAVPVVLENVLSSSIRLGSDLIERIDRDYSNQSLTLKIVSHMAPPVVKLYICGQTKTLNEALHIGEDGPEVLSEREKKKLEIAQKMGLLEAELANI